MTSNHFSLGRPQTITELYFSKQRSLKNLSTTCKIVIVYNLFTNLTQKDFNYILKTWTAHLKSEVKLFFLLFVFYLSCKSLSGLGINLYLISQTSFRHFPLGGRLGAEPGIVEIITVSHGWPGNALVIL